MMGLALLINCALWVYIATAERPREAIVPLHYNIYFGIDLFSEWYKIYYLPTSGAIIFLVNVIIGVTVIRGDKILSAAAAFTTVVVQAVLVASVYLIFTQIYYS